MTQTTVYTANDRATGLGFTAVRFVRDIYRYRHLIWSLFARDFRAQFKQNLLGYLWAVITPLLSVFGFVYMSYIGVLNPGNTGVPYPVYAFVGTSVWAFLTSTISLMGNGLKAQSDLIMRTNVPKIALAASSLASILYGVIVNLVLILGLLLFFRIPLTWSSALFLVLILPMIMLGIGVGLMTSVLGVIVKDASNIVLQPLIIVMYLTPVVFLAKNIHGKLHTIIMMNPLSYLVDVPRSILLGQGTDYWPEFAGATALSLLVFLAGAKVFEIVQDLIAERL